MVRVVLAGLGKTEDYPENLIDELVKIMDYGD